MEHMSKSRHIMVSKKGKRKKTTKKDGKNNKSSNFPETGGTIFAEGSREANEARWDEISSQLSRILRGEVRLHGAPLSVLERHGFDS